MKIHDYEPTARTIDPTERPKASQVVAAAKRARRDDERTEDAPPARRAPSNALPIGVGGLLLFALLVIIGHQFSTTPALKTGVPEQVFQTSPVASQEARTATPAQNPSVAMVNAYASPDGLVLGQIEETRQITPVAHYGEGWIAYQDGPGLVWVRASDMPTLAIVGPDLAPKPAGRGLAPNEWTPPVAPDPIIAPTLAPWPVSAPIVPDVGAPNIKEHLNVKRAQPGQEG